MAVSTLNDKAQEAWVAYLLTFPDIAVAVKAGKSGSDKELNLIIIETNGTEEEYISMTGNYWVHSKITLKYKSVENQTDPDDQKTAALALLATLGDAVNVDDLAEQLSASADHFTVIGVLFDAPSQDRAGDYWEDSFNVRLLCCNNDFPNAP